MGITGENLSLPNIFMLTILSNSNFLISLEFRILPYITFLPLFSRDI